MHQEVQLQRRQELAAQNTYVYHVPQPHQPSDVEWRDIGTLPWNSRVYNKYQASSYGHVMNKDTCTLMALNAKKHSKYDVVAADNTLEVHRLVAKAFLATSEPNQTVINHITIRLIIWRAILNGQLSCKPCSCIWSPSNSTSYVHHRKHT